MGRGVRSQEAALLIGSHFQIRLSDPYKVVCFVKVLANSLPSLWIINKAHKLKPAGDRKARKKKQKKLSCKCDGCSREDCNQCRFCLDRPKNGGLDKIRRRCVERQCVNLACPIPGCNSRYKLPYELKTHVAFEHFRSSLEKKIHVKVREKCKMDNCKFITRGSVGENLYHYGFVHKLLKDIDADVSLISHLL